MKVLGKWWTGKHLCCRCCGQEFALEEHDPPLSGFLHSVDYFAFVTCPSCGKPVNVDIPYGKNVPKERER